MERNYSNVIKGVVFIKIKHGLPKENEETHNELLVQGWKQLKEPKTISGQIVLSLPFMLINLFISQLIVGILAPNMTSSFKISGVMGMLIPLLILLILTVFLLTGHELLHLVFVPNFIKSDKTYIGLTWFGGYVYTEEILTKGRICLISLSPFLLLSVIFNFVIGILGLYTTPILIFIILNSLGSCVDVLGVFLILFQVHAGGKVLMSGIHTYYK